MISYLGTGWLGAFDLTSTRGIQDALTALGYNPGPSDGVMGPMTKAAIKAFQADAGITVDGVAGPETQSAINDRQYGSPTPAYASADLSNVLGVQQTLQQLGYDPGPLDGVMGPMTKAAIMQFQQDQGLAVDGIVGPDTRTAMDARLASQGQAVVELDSPPNPLPPTATPVFIPPWWDETPPSDEIIASAGSPLVAPDVSTPALSVETTAAAADARASSAIAWAKANPVLATLGGAAVLGVGWLALSGSK